MSGPLRIIDTGVRPARWNIAMTQALAELHVQGEMPDTLRLHRYARSVLIGSSQHAADVVDIEGCARKGVEIARRVTGGGAVYMAPGVLAWDLVIARQSGETLENVSAAICGAVVNP